MCRESKRLTPFKPKVLTAKEKTDIQASLFVSHRVDVRTANAVGLARYQASKNNGAWEYQNYVDNFGKDEVETA